MIIINNKEINVTKVNKNNITVQQFPKLFSFNKNGKQLFWLIYVYENGYYRESGFVDGKIKITPPTFVVGKNIGKSNETSDNEQALLEANSLWIKKKAQDYNENVEQEKENINEEENEYKVYNIIVDKLNVCLKQLNCEEIVLLLNKYNLYDKIDEQNLSSRDELYNTLFEYYLEDYINNTDNSLINELILNYMLNNDIDNELINDNIKSRSIKKDEIRIKPKIILPQLANKYDEKKHYLKLPFGGSKKFDGIRVIAQLYDNDYKVYLSSRTGKEFYFMNKIREQIQNMLLTSLQNDIILDGELYSHNLSFNIISGATRSKNKQSIYDDKLEYYIFDIVNENLTYFERMELLKQLEKVYNKLYSNVNERVLKFEYYELITDHSEVKILHDKYVLEGYEGIMLRNLDGKYRIKHRSNDLLKYKQFEDEEFEVVDVEEGKGSESNSAIFVVKDNKSDQIMRVRPRGSVAKRRWQFKNKDKYIGEMLTVRYQNTDNNPEGSLPRFARGINFSSIIEQGEPVDFRDYE